MMTFEDILDQAIEMVRRRGRVTYRTLKVQFELNDDLLAVLKDELLYSQSQIVDDQGRGLAWTGDAELPATALAASVQAEKPAPLTYTPAYLTEKILASRTALEGERKQVTVLFADLKDSTELIKDLDPEAAQRLLDPAIHIMMDAVHRFEGTVNQVLGDGIMALFGAPIAHEDHALRACYAALTMQAAMQPYTDEVRRTHGLTMRMRVGLNSGEVVVRTIRNDLHMDYSAVGKSTHLAARMEQLAAPGSITLTATTLRLVEGFVLVTALGVIPVKGLTEPVETFELTGTSAVRRRLQAAVARGLTTFVGREAELEALTQALTQAATGHGQVVAAVGEAGVGKSRLVYEFLHSHRTQGWRVLEAASVSYGKASPYFPVTELLKRYGDIDDSDTPRTRRAKLTGQVLTLDDTLQETIPALLWLVDALPDDSPFLRLDPPQRRQRTLDGLKRILLRESQVQPLLLVFEDLHWIDAETQALLDSLVESLPMARLLLLVNYRPEYQHSWGSKTYYTQARLDPLPPASSEALLDVLLGNNPSLQPLKQLLIARTEGNPFFIEESVRILVDTQVLTGASGDYRLSQDLPTIHVPPTVQAVLAARIDRLQQDEKQLLQTAAVIGTEVPVCLLQAIAELPEETLYRGLTNLQAAELLYETNLFPERVYTFKHALTHEVAYRSLLQERRRVLHARIVAVLETLGEDRLADQVERLAYHAFRGEVWEKALIYFRQAGAKAAVRSANQEAVACFEQALMALQHLPESHETRVQAIDLRFNIRHVLFVIGELGRMLEHLREAATLAEALEDQRRLGRVFVHMSSCYVLMGEYDRAIAFGQQAHTIAANVGTLGLQGEANFYLGQVYHALGNYSRAMDFFRVQIEALQGESIHERFGMSIQYVYSRTWLAWCLAACGEFAEGIARGDEAIRMAEAADQAFLLVPAYSSVGILYLYRGNLDKAIAMLERALLLCQSVPVWLPWIAAALGSAYALSDRTTEALALLEQAVEQDSSMQIRWGHALRQTWLSEAYLLAGRLEDAQLSAERALDLAQTHKERGHQAWTLHRLGDIARHRDPLAFEPVETYYYQALTLAEDLGMRPLQALCHHGLGRLYSQMGRVEHARAALTTALDMYRTMQMTYWLPEAETALTALPTRAT